ncbi:L-amino-acid oxidase-like [Physella acuta]|uniref:L-amino-acid oxidase-like n=1 Tax=Physella acuta TaxID=109671 RepID=UPI0027DC4C44|nr:L-amino-acid oxidase-like [Physella acuta]
MIYVAFLCLFAVAFGQSQDNPSKRIVEKCQRSVDVAIIGAGASGAYSAYKLKDKKMTIEVIELTDSIGGRHLTTTLPDVSDVKLELGQRVFSNLHEISMKLVKELGLTQEEFLDALGEKGNNRFYLRGQTFTQQDLERGVKIPYELTSEEKQNQAKIVSFYFQKLTGSPLKYMTREERLRVKVIQTNRPLYQHTIDEALDLVASPEGKQFFKDIVKGQYSIYKDSSALLPFTFELDYNSNNSTFFKIKEGMDSLPKKLIEKFLKSDPQRNYLTLNRKLEGIQRFQNMTYVLQLKLTKTESGRTFELGPEEFICAERVILALPKDSLDHLNWSILKNWKLSTALNALKPVPEQKIILSFSKPFWLQQEPYKAKVKCTDTILGSVHDLGSSNNKFLLMTSLNFGEEVHEMSRLNFQGKAIDGSVPGLLQVTVDLKDRVVSELTKIFSVKEQISVLGGVSKFWTLPPHIGGSTVWRAGYHWEDIRDTLLRPSFSDNIYIASPDIAFGTRQAWTEGGLENVEIIMEKYIL